MAELLCAYCNSTDGRTVSSCSGCHSVKYCSLVCQRKAWPVHKKACKKVQAAEKALWEEAKGGRAGAAKGGRAEAGKQGRAKRVEIGLGAFHTFQSQREGGPIVRTGEEALDEAAYSLRVGHLSFVRYGPLMELVARYQRRIQQPAGAGAEEEDDDDDSAWPGLASLPEVIPPQPGTWSQQTLPHVGHTKPATCKMCRRRNIVFSTAEPWTCCKALACRPCREKHREDSKRDGAACGGRGVCPFCGVMCPFCMGEEQVRYGYWARKGDAHCSFLYGRAQMLGHGVPEDDASAFRFLTVAAEAGHSEAMRLLAQLHYEGRGRGGAGGALGDLSEEEWLSEQNGGYGGGWGGGGPRGVNCDKAAARRWLEECSRLGGNRQADMTLACMLAAGEGGGGAEGELLDGERDGDRLLRALQCFAKGLGFRWSDLSEGDGGAVLVLIMALLSHEGLEQLAYPGAAKDIDLLQSGGQDMQAIIRFNGGATAAAAEALAGPKAYGRKVDAALRERDERRWRWATRCDEEMGFIGSVDILGHMHPRAIAKCRQICSGCGAFEAKLKCGKCAADYYCSEECQGQRWGKHKKMCELFALGKAMGCAPGEGFGEDGYAGLNKRFLTGANAVMAEHDLTSDLERQQLPTDEVRAQLGSLGAKIGKGEKTSQKKKGKKKSKESKKGKEKETEETDKKP